MLDRALQAAGSVPPIQAASLHAVENTIGHRADAGYVGRLLVALVGRGHGAEAICFILSIGLEALQDLIVEHDVATPRDIRFRRGSGARAWTSADYSTLLACWAANWRASDIASRLCRSRSSVYYKSRWLGLPKRDRRALLPLGQNVEVNPSLSPSPSSLAGPEETSWTVTLAEWCVTFERKRKDQICGSDNVLRFVSHLKWCGLNNESIAKICRVGPGTINSIVYRLEIPRLANDLRSKVYDGANAHRNIAVMRYEEARDLGKSLFWRRRGSHALSRRDKLRDDYQCAA